MCIQLKELHVLHNHPLTYKQNCIYYDGFLLNGKNYSFGWVKLNLYGMEKMHTDIYNVKDMTQQEIERLPFDDFIAALIMKNGYKYNDSIPNFHLNQKNIFLGWIIYLVIFFFLCVLKDVTVKSLCIIAWSICFSIWKFTKSNDINL